MTIRVQSTHQHTPIQLTQIKLKKGNNKMPLKKTVESIMLKQALQGPLDKCTEHIGEDIELVLHYKGGEGLTIEGRPCNQGVIDVLLAHAYISYISNALDDPDFSEHLNVIATGLNGALESMIDFEEAQSTIE